MRLTAWRICKGDSLDRVFAGAGRRRWSSDRSIVVYTAQSRALATLEMLVHLDGQSLDGAYSIARLQFEDDLVEAVEVERLPPDWAASEPPPTLRMIGDRWAAEQRSAVLRVPSAVVERECNYLINPQHPQFKHVELAEFEPFSFDMRLRER